jgi:hypothetical protein
MLRFLKRHPSPAERRKVVRIESGWLHNRPALAKQDAQRSALP